LYRYTAESVEDMLYRREYSAAVLKELKVGTPYKLPESI
jgi:hypothetical protein